MYTRTEYFPTDNFLFLFEAIDVYALLVLNMHPSHTFPKQKQIQVNNLLKRSLFLDADSQTSCQQISHRFVEITLLFTRSSPRT
jgi:hypothetical protein